MVIDAAVSALQEALAVNRHLVRQMSADQDLTTQAMMEILTILERERVQLGRGLRVLKTYRLSAGKLVERAA